MTIKIPKKTQKSFCSIGGSAEIAGDGAWAIGLGDVGCVSGFIGVEDARSASKGTTMTDSQRNAIGEEPTLSQKQSEHVREHEKDRKNDGSAEKCALGTTAGIGDRRTVTTERATKFRA